MNPIVWLLGAIGLLVPKRNVQPMLDACGRPIIPGGPSAPTDPYGRPICPPPGVPYPPKAPPYGPQQPPYGPQQPPYSPQQPPYGPQQPPYGPQQPPYAPPTQPQGMVRPARNDEIQMAMDNRDKIFVSWIGSTANELRYEVDIAIFGGGKGIPAANLLVAVERGQVLVGPSMQAQPAPGPARALLDEARTQIVVCPINYAPAGAWVEATRTGSFAVRGRLGLAS